MTVLTSQYCKKCFACIWATTILQCSALMPWWVKQQFNNLKCTCAQNMVFNPLAATSQQSFKWVLTPKGRSGFLITWKLSLAVTQVTWLGAPFCWIPIMNGDLELSQWTQCMLSAKKTQSCVDTYLRRLDIRVCLPRRRIYASCWWEEVTVFLYSLQVVK